MPEPQSSHRPRRFAGAIFTALAVLSLVGLFSSLATARTTKSVVKTAHSIPLHRTVLTADNGLTLYTLSAETHGRFICKGACLKTWIPLIVQAGVKPAGPVALGTLKRPDGRRQVTFQGRPLYSFAGDSSKGDANGEGFKDVGTWHAASP